MAKILTILVYLQQQKLNSPINRGLDHYSHWRLKHSTTLDFVIMGLMIVFWFALYFQARINRKKCQPQMHKLDALMNRILGN